MSSLSSNSVILVRLQVCWGLPPLRFPCVFQSMALSCYVSVWSLRVAKPTPSSVSDPLLYLSLPCLSPTLLIYPSKPPKIRWIFLRLSLINTCNFVFNPLISRQISKPYRSTAFTFDPQTLNLILVVIRYKLIHFISKYFVRYLIS